MQPLPHRYSVSSQTTPDGDVSLRAEGVAPLKTAVPLEFDGPGGHWSPETLQVAAALDCFVLTFRGLARVAKLAWTSLECDATGTLDRLDGKMQFTNFVIRAYLSVPGGTSALDAQRVLRRADQTCLIASSLKGLMHLEFEVTEEAAAPA
jgi:organic hydroperoxide reductase OsmC/OhrA